MYFKAHMRKPNNGKDLIKYAIIFYGIVRIVLKEDSVGHKMGDQLSIVIM